MEFFIVLLYTQNHTRFLLFNVLKVAIDFCVCVFFRIVQECIPFVSIARRERQIFNTVIILRICVYMFVSALPLFSFVFLVLFFINIYLVLLSAFIPFLLSYIVLLCLFVFCSLFFFLLFLLDFAVYFPNRLSIFTFVFISVILALISDSIVHPHTTFAKRGFAPIRLCCCLVCAFLNK